MKNHRIWMAGLTLVLASSTANAAYNCGTNPVTVLGDMVLTQDFVTNNSTTPCITVTGGFDVDLNGHSITCTNSTYCAPAIKGETWDGPAGSIIKGPGEIVGRFGEGVYMRADEVDSLTIDGANYGIVVFHVKKIQRNVIINTLYDGIFASMNGAATDTIDNNYISMGGSTGEGAIVVINGPTSGNGAKIEKNYVERYGVGLIFRDTTKFRIDRNAFGERGDVAFSSRTPIVVGAYGSGKTFTENLCPDPTFCPTPPTPFLLP